MYFKIHCICKRKCLVNLVLDNTRPSCRHLVWHQHHAQSFQPVVLQQCFWCLGLSGQSILDRYWIIESQQAIIEWRIERHNCANDKRTQLNNQHIIKWEIHTIEWQIHTTEWQIHIIECQIHTTEWQIHTIEWQILIIEWQIHISEWQIHIIEWQIHGIEWQIQEIVFLIWQLLHIYSPDYFFRITVVNGVDVLTEFWIPFCIDLLHFSQSSTCHKQPACFCVVRENLGKLTDYMLQNVRRRVVQQGLQRRKVDTLLKNVLQSFLGLKINPGEKKISIWCCKNFAKTLYEKE